MQISGLLLIAVVTVVCQWLSELELNEFGEFIESVISSDNSLIPTIPVQTIELYKYRDYY
jgi:hypothetical protein